MRGEAQNPYKKLGCRTNWQIICFGSFGNMLVIENITGVAPRTFFHRNACKVLEAT